jgi:glyoxylase-like metal-dependent hydrolase (beta-lactamase superfamily II)
MMHQPKREKYKIGEQYSTSWEEIFANPRDITLESIEAGSLKFLNRFMLNLSHQNAKDIIEEELSVPVYCHLIQHRIYGNYLVDTGLDRSFQNDIYGNIQGKRREVLWPLKSFQDKGKDIASQLLLKDIHLKGVFLTHLHIDHVAGLQELPKDLQIIVGKDEPYHSYGKNMFQDHFKDIDAIYEMGFSSVNNISPLGPCADIFGDGSFWAIATPGHTKGHVSYLVNGEERIVLITGDACDLKLGFEKCIGPGLGSFNIDLAQKTLEQLIDFCKSYPHIQVVFGHEKS